MNARTFTFTTVILFFLTVSAAAQTTASKNSEQWVRIISPKADFSVALPTEDFIVDRSNGQMIIYCSLNDSSFTVRMEKDRGAKSKFKEESKFPAWRDPKYKFFAEGDFIGWWFTEQNPKTSRTQYSFHLASSEGSYDIWTSALPSDIDIAQRFLRSMRLGTVQIVQVDTHDSPEQRSLAIQDLKVSDIVTQALARPDSTQDKLEIDTSGKSSADDFMLPPGIIYSKPLTILRKPRAAYTDSARSKAVSGTVTLKIVLLANGNIGPITLIKSLEKGLDRQAFDAAKRIKFIPAEIGGKPVDVTKLIEYTFEVF